MSTVHVLPREVAHFVLSRLYVFYLFQAVTYGQTFTAAQTSYLLYASDNNQNFKIARLDANYYNVTTVVSQLNGEATYQY